MYLLSNMAILGIHVSFQGCSYRSHHSWRQFSFNQNTCFEDSKPCLPPSPFQNRFLRARGTKHSITKKKTWASSICRKIRYSWVISYNTGVSSDSTSYGNILQARHFMIFPPSNSLSPSNSQFPFLSVTFFSCTHQLKEQVPCRQYGELPINYNVTYDLETIGAFKYVNF